MDEIVLSLLEWIGDHIVPSDLQVGRFDGLQEFRLQIRCYYVAGWADTPAQPLGDGAAATANLEASPSRLRLRLFDGADRPRIERLLDPSEARSLLSPSMV
jgi:hypothetical protein